MENTCKTCINNDDGLCDRKGILVEDEDSCEHHWAAGKKIRMKRHEKKMDITPELALAAYNTLIQFCRGQPASADGTCDNCILYQHCPGATDLLPEDWATLRYPYLEDNTIYYMILRAMGQPQVNEEWADQHFITKNYSTVQGVLDSLEGGENNVKDEKNTE